MIAAVLILSDKGAAGEREDLSGPALMQWLTTKGVETARYQIIPDDFTTIATVLTQWTDDACCDVLITCGGTGVSPRDVTPEATLSIIDRSLPGFGEAMRAASLKITPMAILSRAMAGIRKNCLIINLPGSPKAAIENLEAVWAAVAHGVEKIGGSTVDCAHIHH
jgi:molybdenum cofactor synthesis domain-containing protein